MMRAGSFLALLLTAHALAFGWGGDAHQIICLIAEKHLTPSARAEIHDLLGRQSNISDAAIANWADEVRRQKQETAPWHFVDIPIEAATFDEARDGAGGNNVIDKVNDFEKVLADRAGSKSDRAEALKYLVHLAGDLHQPLHCAERHHDKGGNGRLVFILDQPEAVSLHAVWDVRLLLLHKGTVRIADYADSLNRKISEADLKRWQTGTPVDWANEAHALAATIAYAGVPVEGPPPKLDAKYVDRATVVIDTQLEKAGVRLARLLNAAFAPASKQ